MGKHLPTDAKLAAQGLGAFIMGWTALFMALFAIFLSASNHGQTTGLLAAALLGYSMQFAGGFSLARLETRGRGLVLTGGAILVGPLGYVMIQGFESVGWFLFLAAPTLIAVPLLLSRRSPLHPNHTEQPVRRIQQRHAIVAAAFVGAVLLLAATRAEIRVALRELRIERFGDQCEEDPRRKEPCGRWAMDLMANPKSFDDLRTGLATFDRLCADLKIHRACNIAAAVRSQSRHDETFERGHLIARELDTISNRACDEGDARGCVVLASDTGLSSAQEKTTTEACKKGDVVACLAWDDESPESMAATCKAGAAGFCTDRPAGECLDGAFATCAGHPDPAAQALAKAPEPRSTNPAMYRVSLEAEDVSKRCDEGSAAACFVMGLNATADINPIDGDPVPMRSLELSMGRACELGANIACYVFALRLLDLDFRATRETGRARELLDVSCGRGHYVSCDLRRLELLEIPKDLDLARADAKNSCLQTRNGACMTWANILAFDLGGTPWPRIESDAHHHHVAACRDASVLTACTEAAADIVHRAGPPTEQFPPLYVRGQSLARFACGAGRSNACQVLFHYAEFAPDIGMKSSAELREKVCVQLPESCPDRPQPTERK